MRMLRLILISCLLIQLGYLVLAEGKDLTGTWESKYQFGSIEEAMTANIQQVGGNLLGSFSVQPSTGDKYSGIIFGTVEGDTIKANYLTVRANGGKDPQAAITFADCHIVDQNTLEGTYYVQDSDMNAISGPFKATRM
jgi:hypothetical protein